MITIDLSEDFRLHIHVTPVRGGLHHLSIKSQWLTARDPEHRETQFAVTLPRRQLLAIAAAIMTGVKP